MQQLLAELGDSQDVVGDDARVNIGDLTLAADEQALPLEGTEAAPLGRLVDHPQRDPVGHVTDDHAEHRQQPPERDEMGQHGDRDSEHEAKHEPEVLRAP